MTEQFIMLPHAQVTDNTHSLRLSDIHYIYGLQDHTVREKNYDLHLRLKNKRLKTTNLNNNGADLNPESFALSTGTKHQVHGNQ